MTIELTKLPYDQDALEPHISARTLSYHYGKHHQAYVNNVNAMTADTDMASMSLEEIIAEARKAGATGLINNSLQVWNHAFFWESMSPNGGGEPGGQLKDMIESAFGDIDTFKAEFKKAAMGRFGSGWVWLVQDGDSVAIQTTGNAESPMGTDVTPLLTLDVWEHAYYLDFQNERNTYTDAFLDKLINWEFAAANLQ